MAHTNVSFKKKTMNTNATTKNEIEMSEPQANLNAKRVQTQITRKKMLSFIWVSSRLAVA